MVPYMLHGANRETEFQVIVLCQDLKNPVDRQYFLCFDNRPLNNIVDSDFVHAIREKNFTQDNLISYRQSLQDLIKTDPFCLETFHVLSFSGKLSDALLNLAHLNKE